MDDRRESAAPATTTFLKLLLLVNLTARPFRRLYQHKHAISLPEWRILLTLAARPSLSATEVGEALGLDKMAVSRAVSALERQGRIERRADPADGRRTTLELTGAGRTLHDAIAPLGRARSETLFGALDGTERATLDRLLDKLVARARDLPDG